MQIVRSRNVLRTRLISLLVASGLCLGFTLTGIVSVVRADAPPLVLTKSVDPDPAVAGDKLTYTLTLTNVGKVALKGVVVSDHTPENTTLGGVGGPDGWAMTSPGMGQTGTATWKARDPLEPGETVQLYFLVIVSHSVQGPIVSADHEARAEGWEETVGGPAVTTQMVIPTPTITPRLLSTPGPIPTAKPSPTPRLVPSQTAQVEKKATPPAVTARPEPSSPKEWKGWWWILIVLAFIIIGGAFIARRGRS